MKAEEIKWAWDHPVIQEILLKYYRANLFVTPEVAQWAVERVVQLAGIRPGAEVLDVGCGLGFHAAAFTRRGFKVTAFDPGDRYITMAREHAAKCIPPALDIDFRVMPVTKLSERSRYAMAWAGAYSPGDASLEEIRDGFRRIWEALAPGGVFVATIAGTPKLPPMAKAREWGELEDCIVLGEKWRDDTFAHEHCWFVYPGTGRIIKVMHVDRMFGLGDLARLIEAAGFVNVETWKDLQANEPAPQGGALAFRCRKPG
jgi:SAM-dependent methyltransferase